MGKKNLAFTFVSRIITPILLFQRQTKTLVEYGNTIVSSDGDIKSARHVVGGQKMYY